MGASDDERDRDRRRRDRDRSRSRSRSRERRRDRDRDRDSRRRSRSPSGSRSRSRSRGRRRERDDRDGRKESKWEGRKETLKPSALRDEEEEEEQSTASSKGPTLAYEGPIPRAQVTESNGEVSCSVEETNRIRALLGLKPLRLEKGESATEVAMRNFAEKRAQEKKEVEMAELEARIERARRRRMLNEKIGGAKLSEVATEEKELLSAADWVKRSRAKEDAKREEERLLAEKRRRLLEEEEGGSDDENKYTAKDLAGLKVAHGLDDFREGEEVVLTLKDTEVLERDEHGNLVGINELGEHELENALISDDQKAKEREKRAKRAKGPAYNALDDEEFEGQPGAKRAILSQYDEEERLKEERRKQGIVLTSEGAVNIGGKREPTDEKKPETVTLKVEKKMGDDFMSVDEVARFNKPKKLRKKKNLRKKEADLVAELEATADQEGGEQEATTREKLANRREEAAAQEAAKRKAAYDAAVEKRRAQDKLNAASLPKKPMPQDDEGEMDMDLQASLERARRLAMQKERKAAEAAEAGGDVGRAVAERLKQVTSKVQEDEAANGAKGVVFTPTVEFSSLLQARLEEGNREKAEQSIEAAKRGARGAVEEEEEEEEDDDDDMDVDNGRPGKKRSTWKEVGNNEDEEEVEELEFLHKQPVVARGMAATLSLLRNTGELVKTERPMGRDKDKKTLYDVGAFGKEQMPEPTADKFKDLKIEYRDKNGRLLTTKEEFRQLCYRFHGYGSSVKNEAKRRKKIEQEEQRASSQSGVGWQALGKAQESSGQAFVVLSGSSKGLGGPAADVSKKHKK